MSHPSAPVLSVPVLLRETPDFLWINKPALWLSVPPSHPRPEYKVLTDWVREGWGETYPVHRLDKPVSGVVLIARNRDAHRVANGWFEKHEILKLYWALAQGKPHMPQFKVTSPIEGKKSITQVEVIEKFSIAGVDYFSSRVRIETGRRHQIRIHLASEGYSILGDVAYGGTTLQNSPFGGVVTSERLALHAERLTLPASSGLAERTVIAPLWPELEKIQETARGFIR
jgi:23S rRNA-/tRNA-specific pseudouridylate synthase